MPIVFALAVSCAYGIPEHYMYGIRADFVPCSTVDSLQTLWPDWNNVTIFHQCRALNLIGTHRCPEPLWFSFWHQVCVWQHQWIAPPPANEITPFPTTQWPGVPTTTPSTQTTVPPITTITPPTVEPPTTNGPTTAPTTTAPTTDDPTTILTTIEQELTTETPATVSIPM